MWTQCYRRVYCRELRKGNAVPNEKRKSEQKSMKGGILCYGNEKVQNDKKRWETCSNKETQRLSASRLGHPIPGRPTGISSGVLLLKSSCP